MRKAFQKALSACLAAALTIGLAPCRAWAAAVAEPGDTGSASAASSEWVFDQVVSLSEARASAVIKEDGSLWMWGHIGNNGRIVSEPIKIMDDAKSVALGEHHYAAIKTDGSLWMWGWNNYGSMCSAPSGIEPTKVMDNVVSVSLGAYASAAVREDGTLWVWGDADDCKLGIGTPEYTAFSTPVKIMDDVRSVSYCDSHGAAIKNDGSLWAWGKNYYGEVGNGTFENCSVPVKVMDDVVYCSLGADNSAAIKSDGTLWMWGAYGSGVLGDGTVSNFGGRSVPQQVLDNVVSVSIGYDGAAAVRTNGTLWKWGGSALDGSGGYQTAPAQFMSDVAAVYLGGTHAAAVKNDRTLWMWGLNDEGQLGDGTQVNKPKPFMLMDGVALPSSSIGSIPKDEFAVEATFKVSGGDGSAETMVNWDDAWFNTSSYTYNHDLATTAAVLSAAAYEESYVEETLRVGLGFDAYDRVEHHPSGNDYGDNYDQVGYSIETRMTGNGVPIIAIVIRGTPGNGEWLSNLNIADTLKGSGQETHEGFGAASLQVLRAFRKYVYDNGIDLNKARVLITGHSRGAAVANILGARLVDGRANSESNGSLAPEHIYDFTFESPTTSLAAEVSDQRYANIFNIVNPEDVVTRVPLVEWGYGRYGNDLVLPSRSNTMPVEYKSELAKMNVYFQGFSGEKFRGYLAGTLTADVVSLDLYSVATSPTAFYKNYLAGVPPRYVLERVVKAAIMHSETSGDRAVLSAALLVPQYRNMLVTLFDTGVLNGAFITGKGIVHGHTQETYVAWMKSALVEPGVVPDIFVRPDYTSMMVACPVDVRAYDADGRLVAAIVNDEVDESLLEDGLPAAVTPDGVKMIDMPAGGGYRLEIEATDDGEMDLTVRKKDGSGSAALGEKCYLGVSLDAGDSFTVAEPESSDVEDCVLVDRSTGVEAEAASTVSGSEIKKIAVSVSADGQGEVWGGGEVVAGAKTTLHAKASDGYAFVGWERESVLSDGTSAWKAVAGGGDLEVRVDGDVAYRALFRPVPEFPDVDGSQWYAEGVGYCAAKGLITGYTAGKKAGWFGVGDTLTRAQLATILWRNACPDEYAAYDPKAAVDTTGIAGSADGMYYTAAANWAVEKGVITGVERADGTFDFDADGEVTFEQTVTILGRLCATPGELEEAGSDLSGFVDGDSASPWSRAYLSWAVYGELVSGYDEPDGKYLRPHEPVARERAAVVLARAFEAGILK